MYASCTNIASLIRIVGDQIVKIGKSGQESPACDLALKCYNDQKIIPYFPSDFESVFA